MRIFIAVLITVLSLGLTVPSGSRAGTIGDAVSGLGAWISDVEASVAGWFERTWTSVTTIAADSDDLALERLKLLATERPGLLGELSEKTGWTLVSYTVEDAEDPRDSIVRLRFESAGSPDDADRATILRSSMATSSDGPSADLLLMRVLLDATVRRDAGSVDGYRLTGVEIELSDELSKRLIHTMNAATTPEQSQ